MKKGFTLIELLTVIVILAIIALIASPIIINLIEDSNQKSATLSVDQFVSATKLYYNNELTNNDGIFNNNFDLIIALPTTIIETDGNEMEDGKVILKQNGNVLITELIKVKNYYCGYNNNDRIFCSKNMYDNDLYVKKDDGTTISMSDVEPSNLSLFDIGTNFTNDCIISSQCSLSQIKSGLSVDVAVNDTDTLKFYVIADDGNEVTLMADQVLLNSNWVKKTDYIAASGFTCTTYGCNTFGPLTSLETLKTATDDWSNIPPLSNFTYTEDRGTYGYSNIEYVDGVATITHKNGTSAYQIGVTYDKLKARLITAPEIASIAELNTWNIIDGDEVSLSSISWIYNNSTSVGFNTLSSNPAYLYAAWYVYAGGFWFNLLEQNYGIKPVITIKKLPDNYDASLMPTVSLTPRTNPNVNGWYKQDVVVDLAATDAHSTVTELLYCVGTEKCNPITSTNNATINVTVNKNIYDFITEISLTNDLTITDNLTENSLLNTNTTGSINYGTVGTYPINYGVTDLAGNTTIFSRNINVISSEGIEFVHLPAGKKVSTLAVGDIIKIVDEEFHYIGTEGTGSSALIKMLSRYNLDVGYIYMPVGTSYLPISNPTGIQSSRALGAQKNSSAERYGVTPFSTTSINYSGSLAEGYVNNYRNYLLNIGAPNTITSRIPTLAEVTSLGCSTSSGNCQSSSFVTTTSYWINEPNSQGPTYLYNISSEGYIFGNQYTFEVCA